MLVIKNLKKNFIVKKPGLSKEEIITAVDDISFSVMKGESYGIIGESGSGKSTIGNLKLYWREVEQTIINRPGVVGAVLQTASSFINYLIN